MEKLSENIKLLRAKLSLTQQQMAKQIGISHQSYVLAERGLYGFKVKYFIEMFISKNKDKI